MYRNAGEDRLSIQGQSYALREQNGTVQRSSQGVFGLPYSALFVPQGKGRGRLAAERTAAPGLNIGGNGSTVTLAAWVQPLGPTSLSDHGMMTIAGIWSEDLATRQYVLFVNGPHKRGDLWPHPKGAPKHIDISHRVNAQVNNAIQSKNVGILYNLGENTISVSRCRSILSLQVSDVGGPTAGEKFCTTRAWGATDLTAGDWHCLVMTYDTHVISAYVNGTLDSWQLKVRYYIANKQTCPLICGL